MKILYNVLGGLFLVLAVIGVFLPLLPTTPFLLLSAALFYKGSDRYYRWLMQHPRFGPYIENYRIYKAIPVKTKIISLSLLWITILISVFFVLEITWLRILLLLIALGVSIHILSFKTLKIKDREQEVDQVEKPVRETEPNKKSIFGQNNKRRKIKIISDYF